MYFKHFFFVVYDITVCKYNQQYVNDNEQATNSAEIRQKRKQINQHRLQTHQNTKSNVNENIISIVYQRDIAAQRDRRHLHRERFRRVVEVVLRSKCSV